MFQGRCGLLFYPINNFRRYFGKVKKSQDQTSHIEKMVLYGDEASPPVRFSMMTASILNIKLDFHNVDLFKSENKTEFYTKINPNQKVPALSINGKVICDSHAIGLYLCRISRDQDLYSKNTIIKAKVDEMLFFNATNLFPVDSFIYSEYFAKRWPVEQDKVKQWFIHLNYLEYRLTKNKWMACDQMQLCDLCCAATVSSMELLIPCLDKYTLLRQWMMELEKIPCFEINRKGLRRLNNFIKALNM